MHILDITTRCREETVDITSDIQRFLDDNKFKSGVVVVTSPHTTAGITVNENADPDVRRDILSFFKKAIPQNQGFAHVEGNSDAHIKGSLVGFSQTFIVENGKLHLGTWQGVYFMEFDGPRQRHVWLKFLSEKLEPQD
ncbi:MAG: secondary thiamine-phosphate synthase enzyme YjbQ [Candidatus Aceula meridiana]|nr:secondary thiamine-phosphate synthase enzyme YjbQ [Candidatus Aceula meridiana]